MAAGVSIGDEGQGREGEVLDTSYKSNDGTRLAVPASLMNVHCKVCASRSRQIPVVSIENRFRLYVSPLQVCPMSAITTPPAAVASASSAIQAACLKQRFLATVMREFAITWLARSTWLGFCAGS